MEVSATKHPACKRTSEWTQSEKDAVLDKLMAGRKPLTELTRALNGTKSLRQVAEFIEKLEFWKQIISQDQEHQIEHEEAEEASDVQILTEDMQASRLGSEDRDLLNPQPAKRRKNNVDDVIQQRTLQRVVKRIADNRNIKIDDETFVFVEEQLHGFLRKIIFQLAIEAKLTYMGSRSNGKTRVIQLEDMRRVLQEHGFEVLDAYEPESQNEAAEEETSDGTEDMSSDGMDEEASQPEGGQ
ncbi:hypothetical protein EV183_004349 [Coemansia sp. RSA 2336]|nr:hypothetical protein EV183_004349 [Coemansia sp. RSA 2336]